MGKKVISWASWINISFLMVSMLLPINDLVFLSSSLYIQTGQNVLFNQLAWR